MPLTVSIITPEKAFDPVEVDSVNLPAFDGRIGILPKHAPFVCLLGAGELELKSHTRANQSYALRGGVAQVAKDEVRILAEQVAPVDEITEEDIVKRLSDLDAQEFEDGLALAEAKSTAHWLVTQLKAKGKTVPELKKLK